MTSPHHYYLRKGGGEGKKIRLREVEPNRCSFRKVPVFALQQNKQMAELEQEPNCSIISQLAGSKNRIDHVRSVTVMQKLCKTPVREVRHSRETPKFAKNIKSCDGTTNLRFVRASFAHEDCIIDNVHPLYSYQSMLISPSFLRVVGSLDSSSSAYPILRFNIGPGPPFILRSTLACWK
jgi:hypothetical protein